jgi:hypothetical protein
MGERYFSISLAIIMVLLVFLTYGFLPGYVQREMDKSWMLFMLIFIIAALIRRFEIKKFGSTYNYDRFSYTDGEQLDFLNGLYGREYLGIKINQFILYVFIEPLLPLLTGILFSLIPFTRSAGIFILICSVSFAIRNFLKAHAARSYVLDIIDEHLAQEWKYDAIVEGKPKSETKGIGLPIDLPPSRDLREDLSKSLDQPKLKDIWKKRGDEDLDTQAVPV